MLSRRIAIASMMALMLGQPTVQRNSDLQSPIARGKATAWVAIPCDQSTRDANAALQSVEHVKHQPRARAVNHGDRSGGMSFA